MNIAICFSGQPRNIKETQQAWIEHLVMYHNVDVYVHGWSTEDTTEETKELIQTTWQPKRMLLEPEKDFWFNNICGVVVHEHNPHLQPRFGLNNQQRKALELKSNDGVWFAKPYNTLSMLYSRFQSNLLRKFDNKTYDLVVSTRFDLNLFDQITCLEDIKPNELVVPEMPGYHPGSRVGLFACDHVLIGDSNTTNIATDAYHFYHSFYSLGIPVVPEIILGTQVMNYNINLRKEKIDYKLWRDIKQ